MMSNISFKMIQVWSVIGSGIDEPKIIQGYNC